jgi:hypothetical protein
MTARMCDAPAKRLLEPQGISGLLRHQMSTDDKFMPRLYEPDLGADPDIPFARDASNKLVSTKLLVGHE